MFGILRQLLVVLPLVYGVMTYPRLRKDMRLLVIYLGISLVESCLMILLWVSSKHNLWLANVLFPTDVGFYTAIFLMWELNTRRRIIWISGVGLYMIAAWSETIIFGADRFTQFDQPVGWTLVVIGAAYTLYTESRKYETDLTGQASFWYSAGMLIVAASQIMLALMNGIAYTASEATLRIAHTYIKPAFGLLELGVFWAAIHAQAATPKPQPAERPLNRS